MLTYDADIYKKMEDVLGKYRGRYWGCAETTFAIISETLNLQGREAVTRSLVGLSGGVANFGTGCCGAIAGAATAISLHFNIIPERTEEGLAPRNELFDVIAEVVTRFERKYGGLSCRDVLMTIFGKSFDFRQPERLKEYWAMDRSDVTVVGDAARWAIEAILESQSKRHVKEEKRFDTRSI